MRKDYFEIMRSGLYGELKAVEVPEVLAHLSNHLGNFILEPATISAYVMRLLEATKSGPLPPEALTRLAWLLTKYERLEPFETPNLRILAQIAPSPELEKRIRIVEGVCRNLDAWKRLHDAVQRFAFEWAVPKLEGLLATNRHDVMAAGTLLLADHLRGQPPGDWLATFEPVPPLRAVWERKLFLHHAGLGDAGRGLPLFERLEPQERNEYVLSGAAELFFKAGDRQRAIELHEASLAIDPEQAPVRLRLAELASPMRPRPDLLASRSSAVYLYTYNKADVLRQTIESLSQCELGGSAVSILINGCSDDSLAVAESAKQLFPENSVDIVNLPINIGAPAARNWLINREQTWSRDYVAFLDDDVLLQPDWLSWFLAAMEDRPKAAVVGCKILDPGSPARFQYLYRSIAIARPDLLKLSLARPSHQFDTGLYDFLRPTRSVMGCQHMFRTSALREEPFFDIRFSPSQVDDIDHDLLLCLKGHEVLYCGQVGCVHVQSSGLSVRTINNPLAFGNAVGNDIKLFYKHSGRLDELRALDSGTGPSA